MERATENVLYHGINRLGADCALVHRTAGLVVTGSGMIEKPEAWGYRVMLRDGTRHGQWFDNLAAAQAHYDARVPDDEPEEETCAEHRQPLCRCPARCRYG